MKKIFLLVLFLHAGLLYAQNIRQARVYVPPVTGVGRLGDNAYFYRQISNEVVIHFHSLVRSARLCDFIIKGEIEPYIGVSRIIETDFGDRNRPLLAGRSDIEFFSVEAPDNPFFGQAGLEDELEEDEFFLDEIEPIDIHYSDDPDQEFLFYLALLDNITGNIIAQQEIIYLFTDSSVDILLSVIVYNMLSSIPDVVEYYDWRDKWFFVNASLLWSPRIYRGDYQSVSIGNVGIGLSAESQFFSFMALRMGVELIQDWVVVSETTGEAYRDMILEIPLALKLVFKLSENYMLEPYAGLTYNFSLQGITNPFIISWMGGLQLCVQAGPGMITIDPRISIDMEHSQIMSTLQEYHRFVLHIGMGYKIGFFPKGVRRWR